MWLPVEEHFNWLSVTVSPENTHTSHIICTEQVIFRTIYSYIYTYIQMHICMQQELMKKEAIDLKESVDEYI